MSLLQCPTEILELIMRLLDVSSALSFIQVNRQIYNTFGKDLQFWRRATSQIGLPIYQHESIDTIKCRFLNWKTGHLFIQLFINYCILLYVYYFYL